MSIVRTTLALLVGAVLFAAVPKPAAAQAVFIMSGMGGKCLDAEGGSTANGTRLIGYACQNSWNQKFTFNSNGTITLRGKCLDAAGGQGRDGDQIVLWDCNGGANQKWRASGNQLVGINGKCLDLKGGRGHWFGNQPVILWACNGGENQAWTKGYLIDKSRVPNARVIQPGQLADMTARVVASGGANVVASGGANVVAAGGANVVAAGGLN